MITFDQFITKWLNKKIDWDGAFGAQCVDLYRQYVFEVIGCPQSPPVDGAAAIWTTYLSTYFTRIANTPDGIPVKGDIMIWNRNVGYGYGHVGVFTSGDVMSFTSLDQNWSIVATHYQRHDYANVLGWLHPKTISPPMTDRQALTNIKTHIYGQGDDSTVRTRVKEILVKVGV